MTYIKQSHDQEEWKRVNNLGWLLRKWQNVDRFEVVHPTHKFYHYLGEIYKLPEREMSNSDCWLIAFLHGNKVFVTEWASSNNLLDWLDRPIFQGAGLMWFGLKTTVRKEM